jgi:hypothetical protein
VTFIIAAIVDPEDDRSIAITRDCFELGSDRLILGSPAIGRAEFEGGTDAADDAVGRCFAEFAIEISVRFLAASGRTTEAPSRP